MSRPNWIGQTLGGRYKIESLLGQGGMSAVYQGTDPNLRRTVAIKLIHGHLTGDPEFVRRFEAEAAAVAQLRHPNIIQVFDFNHDDDTYYMVLEYLPGETLHSRLRRLGQSGQALPVPEALTIATSIAEAIDYAHKRGLLHRDIKPANIMLNPSGDAVLMDFGVAKILGGASHTATGAVVGTAQYLSPEQVLGQRPTERSDIYSLGVTLFEMIVGRAPFEADSAMTLMLKHVNEPVPNIKDLKPETPAGLVVVVERAMAKDPAQRFQSGGEMAQALRSVQRALEADAARPTERMDRRPDKAAVASIQPSRGTAPGGPVAPASGPAVPAGPRLARPPWLLIAAPIAVVLCLGALAAGVYAVANLRGTPTAAPATASQAAVAEVSPSPQPAATVAPTAGPTASLPPAATGTVAPQPTLPVEGMVRADGGTFLMGTAKGQADERPAHQVAIGAFHIDQYEVTNARYQKCVVEGACTPPSQNGSFHRIAYFDDPEFADYPVVNVNWNQAVQFCRWDGNKRLPTEAEWEYAATGGDGRRYPWGDEFDARRVPAQEQDTIAVGNLDNASPIGALDLSGNVLEWVADVYDSKYYSQAPAENPGGPAAGTDHVARGGSFGNSAAALYTATRRYHFATNVAEVDIGFRCAIAAP